MLDVVVGDVVDVVELVDELVVDVELLEEVELVEVLAVDVDGDVELDPVLLLLLLEP